MITHTWHSLLTAVMFYTRIPVSASLPYSQALLNHSRHYFPLVGLLVGGIAALTFWLGALLWPPSVALLLSLVASILATGAFHEDGFADCCDGFGGGWQAEQVLRIMKDSRLGTYGVSGLVLMLAAKYLLLFEMAQQSWGLVVAALLFGHSYSRWLASWLMQQYAYVRDTEQSKIKPMANDQLSTSGMWLSGLPCFLSGITIALISPWLLLSALAAVGVQQLAGAYFNKRLGGYTGDCLGAAQQLCELTVYGGLLALCQWI